MSVKALFKCQSVTEYEGGNKEVKFTADYNGGKGNEDYAKYTPSADMRLVITTGTTANTYFQPGKSYELVISEAAQ